MNAIWIPKRLGSALALGAILAFAGGTVFYLAQQMRQDVQRRAQAATEENRAMQARLSQGIQEKSEIGAKLDEYRRLLTRGVIGTERRLDWVDALLIVREENKLLDLKYSIGPQKPLNYPEVAQSSDVQALASPITLELAMLHEGDLFRVLAGLRQRLPPYMVVNDCMMERIQISGSTVARDSGARLIARCVADLVTIRDRVPESSK